MASPMVESRVDPHKKAQYTLHISDQIADGEVGDYTSIRFNHKPAQPTSQRNTTISSTSPNDYTLRIEDKKGEDGRDVFIFTGQKTVPKRSYILLFEPASQKATLEPLANMYTFNVSTKNGIDMSSAYPKIYPRKQKDDVQEPPLREDIIDDSRRDDVTIAADAENPYDFRHFLGGSKDTKNGHESEYNRGTSSPDYRTGTGSSANTPQFAARKPNSSTTATSSSSAPKQRPPATQKAPPKSKKRKSPEPEPKKSSSTLPRKPPPAVRLERRATTDTKAKPAPSAKSTKPPAKKAATAAAPSSSKIKSAELVHSSDDESDPEDMLNLIPATTTTTTKPPVAPQHRSPSPPPTQPTYAASASDMDASDEDEDDDAASGGGGGLEIEFEDPDDAQPPTKTKSRQQQQQQRNHRLGLLNSPANGPISLASVASSVEGTPRTHRIKQHAQNHDNDGVIDFDNLGGAEDESAGEEEEEDGDAEGEVDDDVDDVDVEPIDIGPPAARTAGDVHDGGAKQQQQQQQEEVDDVEMEDLLYKEVMEGLADGDSSEESEEE